MSRYFEQNRYSKCCNYPVKSADSAKYYGNEFPRWVKLYECQGCRKLADYFIEDFVLNPTSEPVTT